MKRAMRTMITCVLAVGLLCGSTAMPYTYVYADETFSAYEKTAIEDDLKDVDAGLYPANPNGVHRLIDGIGFTEYAYSTSAFANQYYGIYFYVYSPTEKPLAERAGAQVVNMAVEYNDMGEPSAYENVELRLLDETANHRFFKFGFADQRAAYARARAYADRHDGVRRYDIAGVQLWFQGDENATDANAERDNTSYTYLCTGYAQGCSEESSEKSTLNIERQELRTLLLDVHHTYYRPEGTNGKTQFTHDSLNSIYFSVPKEIIESYGEMSGIKGKYLRALTKDIFVTGNETYYQMVKPKIGVDVGYYVRYSDSDFKFIAGSIDSEVGMLHETYTSWVYHIPEVFKNSSGEYDGKGTNTLYYLFKATNGDADTYDVSTTMLVNYMKEYTRNHSKNGKELVGGKFHPDLFAEVDAQETVFDFNSESVTEMMQGQTITQNSWQKFWGTQSKSDFVFLEQKKVIDTVKGEDFVLSDNSDKLNVAEISKRLFVAETDVQELYDYYVANKETSDIYMIRFAVDDYVSAEAKEGLYNDSGDWGDAPWDFEQKVGVRNVDTNCYLSQEYVYLNFEIIETRFTLDGKETVIPVVMSPIDIVPDVTHPSVTTKDKSWRLIIWLSSIAGGLIVFGIVALIIKKNSAEGRD